MIIISKDKLKNMVSMAIKDPVLRQGFELICKENTDLRLDLEALEEADNININHCMKVNGQLWKAKGIIKRLLNVMNGDNTERTKVVEEAEQFLSITDNSYVSRRRKK